jgi:hypothetical protein
MHRPKALHIAPVIYTFSADIESLPNVIDEPRWELARCVQIDDPDYYVSIRSPVRMHAA